MVMKTLYYKNSDTSDEEFLLINRRTLKWPNCILCIIFSPSLRKNPTYEILPSYMSLFNPHIDFIGLVSILDSYNKRIIIHFYK